MTGRRSVLSLLVLVMICTGCGSSGSAAPKATAAIGGAALIRPASIVLDWLPNSDHAGIYTAAQQGIFRRHGVNPTIRVPSSSTAQIQLVGAGRTDFAVTYEADLLNAVAQHVPVRSVMCIMQHPLNTVMALRSSGISRPRDLVGKRIGMAGSPSDEPIVRAVMATDHATLKPGQMVNVGYNLLPALLSRKVDAVVGVYWTWEAILARQRGYPVNVMRVERWGVPNYCELVLIANNSTIRSRPGYVRSVVQSLQEGYVQAESHPQLAWQALHAADRSLDRKPVLQSIELLHSAVLGVRSVGYQDPAQWTHYAAWLYANKLLAKRIDARTAFTNQFLAPLR